MKCEFEYCIYNKECKCALKEIGVNSLGMCEECIIVGLDKVFLESEKEKQLREIENRFTE